MKQKIKQTYGYAILTDTLDSRLQYAFTWDRKHPREKIQKSEMVFAIYPTKKQAIADIRFRGGTIIKKIILK